MKRRWVGTGWKMNHLIAEADEYAVTLRDFVDSEKPASDIFICVPFTVLHSVSKILEGNAVHVAAQNCHWLDRGAATGEISPLMVRDAGGTMIEIGHSERRQSFGESDATVNLKVKATLAQGLRPIICIGETLEDKDYGVSVEALNRELKIALHEVSSQQASRVLIAYEPVWAIGEAGIPAAPEYVQSVHHEIKRTLCQLVGEDTGQQIPVIYGGSVNPKNATSLVAMPDVDGLFIGRAAWNVTGFTEIIRDVELSLEGPLQQST
jgi:triosephosphate isomerase